MLIVVILAMLALLFLSLRSRQHWPYLGFFLDAFYMRPAPARGLATMSWAVQSGDPLVAVPMFILLGEILVRSGVAGAWYRVMQWLSWLPGGADAREHRGEHRDCRDGGLQYRYRGTVSTVSVPLVRRRPL